MTHYDAYCIRRSMQKLKVIAVIDIGSSAIRLLIAQNKPTGEWDLVDSAERSLALGRDVFRGGSIERKTMNHAVTILNGFMELMAPYEVDRIVAVGTSALRESKNREIFIDRVLLQTGIEVKVIDGVEANQLTWLAVREPLEAIHTDFKSHKSMILEVGAGNTELMILRKGNVRASYALPIGALRYLQRIDNKVDGSSRESFRLHVSRNIGGISHELGLSKISKLVAIGSDVRLVASQLGESLSPQIAVIPRAAFRQFVREIESHNPDELVEHLNLPWSEAELLYPALIILDTFVESTRADEVFVPSGNIRQGLLINYATDHSALRELFSAQVVAGSREIAKHYHSDMKHAEFVRKQALVLYDKLNMELGLKDRLLLESAALLHDIGVYISAASHHKHSQYIIQNSDIFGLSAADKEIVGHIVRYHRGAQPRNSHALYMKLDRRSRIVVQKLAALLRVADALDRSHTQSVVISNLKVGKNKLSIITTYAGDISMEELGLSEKADLFENLFGLKVVLRN